MTRPAKTPAGELALISEIRRRAAARGFRHLQLGIGDDCAILSPPPGHELLVTTDFSLENRHFRRAWHSPASVGHRALARGLSDIAAMGGTPLAAFLSLALPRSLARNPSWLNSFLDGLLSLADAHNVPLAGGDTSESPSDLTLADIILLGSAPRGRALRRSSAKPGDTIYVTGSLGGAAAELNLLAKSPARYRKAAASDDHPHLFPQPRLAVGQVLLRRRLATACIDISDGLSTDLAHLCEESHVAARVEAVALPLHRLTQSLMPTAALHAGLHGGEDYELLFTARPTTRIPRSIAGVRVTPIGTIVTHRHSRPRVTLVEPGGRPAELLPQGWQHFV